MHVRRLEMAHEERLKSIEKGLPLAPIDDRGSLAGRVALLVPMVVMIAAATVSSFLVVYKSENCFAVSLAIWVVAGLVSLAAVRAVSRSWAGSPRSRPARATSMMSMKTSEAKRRI